MPMAEEKQDREHPNIARYVIAGVLTLLLIAFVFDNTRKVKVGFVVGTHQIRLIYVLIVTVAIGVALDRLWLWRRHRKE
jgi:uncharacterized integral membrane protein